MSIIPSSFFGLRAPVRPPFPHATGAAVLALSLFLGGCSVVQGAPGQAGPLSGGDSSEEVRGGEAQAGEGRAGEARAGEAGTGEAAIPGVDYPLGPTLPSPLAATPTVPLARHVRALWVVRTALTHPDSIRALVDRAAGAGFNLLLVQIRGRGDAYYNSRWEPKPATVLEHGAAFDPLAMVIQEAHELGIGVHAWINAHLVGGNWDLPPDPTHILRRRPDLLAVPRELARELYGVDPEVPRYADAILQYAQRNTDLVEGLYTSPSNPEVKEHLYAVWMDLVERYDLDGLHFDYIRYPNPDFDYSTGALDLFREWVLPRISPARQATLDRAFQDDPLAYVDSLPGPWSEFRRHQITELVERIYFGVKKRRPGVVVSAAVFANADDAYASRYQDWRRWVADGILDAVVPMAYTPDNDLFEGYVQDAIEAAGRGRVWAGVGVYLNTYEGTVDKIRIAESLGTRGVVLFSYNWAVSEGEARGGRTFLERVGAEAFRR